MSSGVHFSTQISALSIDTSEKIVAVGFVDNSIKCLSLENDDLSTLLTLELEYPCSHFVFSSDSSILLAACENSSIYIIHVPSNTIMGTLSGHVGPITSLSWSSTHQTIASTSADETARIWDIRSRQQVHCLRAHMGALSGGGLSSDGSLLATSGIDGTLRLWDARHGSILDTLRPSLGPSPLLSMHMQGSLLVAVRAPKEGVSNPPPSKGSVELWSLETKPQLLRTLSPCPSLSSLPVQCCIWGDGVACGSDDGLLHYWRFMKGEMTYQTLSPLAPPKKKRSVGDAGFPACLVLASMGDTLVAARGGSLELYISCL
eukprot:gnl/Dysnectes_brevis/2458_a2934_1449.p1 GENE.gnl/Dysnectes_brevis/2458_a2934_1449~~gnl/Dysnectes_brevis/2458_a2934_1449.p1  ORF type:complete len:317 (-),score=-0.98 gnl/Dysnectes_brevis/2458_a2934_1449:78-1028(-)